MHKLILQVILFSKMNDSGAEEPLFAPVRNWYTPINR